MNGLCLYCIRKKVNTEFDAKGVYDEGKTFVLPYKNLEAVVSEVPLDEFDFEQIQQKAQEDLNWIKEKAQLHEAVIEEAMQVNGKFLAVIPMRFGAIFKNKEKIQQNIETHYTKFENLLTDLQGKQEWSVKVYLENYEALEQEVKNGNEAVKAKEKEIAAMPKGMAYFFEKQLEELISTEMAKNVENCIQDFFLTIKKYAENGLQGKILHKELTGKIEPMILNAIYLIKEEKIQDFKIKISRLRNKMKTKGFLVEYSGPWPPYNFAKV